MGRRQIFINPGKLKFLLLPLALSSSQLIAGSNTAYINDIPDFTQSHITGWQTGHGAEFCAPVVVSNSLLWMTGMRGEQAELAKLLASSRYMNTDVWKGTSTAGILSGVHAIAMDLFGDYKSLEYQGWKRHPARYSTRITVPDIHWITQGIAKDTAVWLNVGWYQYDRQHDIYHRVGGHWVTLVGYDDTTLIIHDPAPRAGQQFANEYVHTSHIEGGALDDRATGLYKSARGYLLLGKGMHIKPVADVAIVDGAVRFRR